VSKIAQKIHTSEKFEDILAIASRTESWVSVKLEVSMSEENGCRRCTSTRDLHNCESGLENGLMRDAISGSSEHLFEESDDQVCRHILQLYSVPPANNSSTQASNPLNMNIPRYSRCSGVTQPNLPVGNQPCHDINQDLLGNLAGI
jgi:hypothetical protein